MKRIIAFIFCFFIVVSTVDAANYYVSQSTGDDGNVGSEVSPWQYAPWMPSATSTSDGTALTGDDFVYLKRGDTWTAEPIISEESGTSGHPITFDAYGTGALPILNGNNNTGFSGWYNGVLQINNHNYITVKNIEFRYCNKDTAAIIADGGGSVTGIILDGCTFDYNYSDNLDGYMALMIRNDANSTGISYITIQNCTIQDTGHNGIRIWNQDTTSNISYGTIKDNVFFDCDHHGVDMYRDSGIMMNTYFTITGNTFQECGGAFYVPNMNNSTIAYNKIWDDNTDQSGDTYGIKLDDLNGGTPTGNVIVGNIIWDYDSATGGHAIWLYGTSGTIVANNTIYSNYAACTFASNTSLTNSNNLSYANTGDGSCADYGSDPKFTNSGSDDFTLQSDSTAIGAGADLGNGLLYGLDPISTWTDNVKPIDQDSYGDWELGAFVYIEAAELGGPGTIAGGGSGSIAGGGSGSIIGTAP